ncbi:MAG: GGDEF domain-containing protein [Cocleimonas sp.]
MSISSPTDPGHTLYFGFLIVIIMVLFAWTYIPLYEIVINSSVLIFAYSVSIYVGNNVTTDVFLNELIPSVFVMLGALCAGFVGRAINENHVRQTFLYRNSLKELADKQNYYANHDDLTGLPNRRSSEHFFQEDLNHALEHNNLHFVMLFDLNYFKAINDEYGHQTGDAVLKVIAKRLKSCTREEDHVCRIGGDEFAISLVVENNNINFVKNLQRKITDSVTQPIKLGDQMLRVGISIGIASFPEDGKNIRVLLNIADGRMYEDKFIQKKIDVLGHSRGIEASLFEK